MHWEDGFFIEQQSPVPSKSNRPFAGFRLRKADSSADTPAFQIELTDWQPADTPVPALFLNYSQFLNSTAAGNQEVRDCKVFGTCVSITYSSTGAWLHGAQVHISRWDGTGPKRPELHIMRLHVAPAMSLHIRNVSTQRNMSVHLSV